MSNYKKGENHPASTLTDAQVDAIRELFKQHPQTSKKWVADELGVDRTTISKIVHNHSRKRQA